jgi:hypothetical protein
MTTIVPASPGFTVVCYRAAPDPNNPLPVDPQDVELYPEEPIIAWAWVTDSGDSKPMPVTVSGIPDDPDERGRDWTGLTSDWAVKKPDGRVYDRRHGHFETVETWMRTRHDRNKAASTNTRKSLTT